MFSGLRNRKKATSPTVVADETLLLSTQTLRSDGEALLLHENFSQLIATSTTAVEMVETFALNNTRRATVPSSAVAQDSEIDLEWEHSGLESDDELGSDWEHLNEADAHLPGSLVAGESRQAVEEILSGLIEDAVLVAEQLRKQEEKRQAARFLQEHNQQREEKANACVNAALLLAEQELQAEAAEEKRAVSQVSLPVVLTRADDYLPHIKPPIPYSTLFCMQSLQASKSSDPQLVSPIDPLYQSAQVASVKAGILAARHKMDGSNGIFSVGQPSNPMMKGFFQCFLGVPIIAAGLLSGLANENVSENRPNIDSNEDASQMARLTYGNW
jgi:hypothetical protein